MPGTNYINVPQAVRQTAAEALELNRTLGLPAEQEASGFAIAERLASGEVTAQDIGALSRFFSVNGRHYETRLQALKSARTDGLCRSWMLRGGDHARVWAERLNASLVAEGVLPADPYAALLKSSPEEVYARFAVGAWRWEYGLSTPAQAAKFYEDYQRATGKILDLSAAFGPSGPAVANATMRRVSGVDPFAAAKRALQFEDAEYRLAATVDLRELRASSGLDENIKPFVFAAEAKLAAKIVWPAFVAYFILAAERRELLKDLHGESKRPPTLDQDPGSLIPYSDAVRIYITYFHPKGAKYVSPSGTDFEGIDEQISELVLKAYFGKPLQPVKVQKMLGLARRWTAQNKLAGSLFHVYNADWKKGNWPNILEAIPQDADVLAPFTTFVNAAPIPADGVKLQQTLNNKAQLEEIAKKASVKVDDLKQKKIGETEFGIAAAAAGTPVGIYSLIRTGTLERVLLGCFHVFSEWRFATQLSDGQIAFVYVADAAAMFSSGVWKVLKGHKDMKIVYGPAQTGPKAAVLGNSHDSKDPTIVPAISKDAQSSPGIDADKPAIKAVPKPPAPENQKPKPATPPVPMTSAPKTSPDPFGMHVGDVFFLNEAHYLIVAIPTSSAYVESLPLKLMPWSPWSHVTSTVSMAESFKTAKFVGNFQPDSIYPFFTFPESLVFGNSNYSKPVPVTSAGPLKIGSIWNGDSIVAMFTMTSDQDSRSFAICSNGLTLRLVSLAATVAPVKIYAPVDPVPESDTDADANCGTAAAIDFMLKKGWTPATAADSLRFKFSLGAVLKYGVKTRTIIGYAINGKHPVYVILTDLGNVNWKSATAGNVDYGPVVSMSTDVLNELLPKPSPVPAAPTSTKPVKSFPRLNYRLGEKAKYLANKFDLLYQPSPANAPFKVGVPLTMSTGLKTRIIGWVTIYDKPEAVLDTEGDGKDGYAIASIASLSQLSIVFTNKTSVTHQSVVFGKSKGDESVTIVNDFSKPKILLPCDLPDGWDLPDPVSEPQVPSPKDGKHIAAGIIAIFPCGVMSSSPSSGLKLLTGAGVVLRHPANEFGGYKLAIPKGTVDSGESPLIAAVREFKEETGWSAKPVAYLGDYQSNTSIVRLYMGFVTGGKAQTVNAQEETDAVVIHALSDFEGKIAEQMDWWKDLIPESGTHWQQKAIQDAQDWMQTNGVPQTYVSGDAPSAHSAVTLAVPEPIGGSATKPEGGMMIQLEDTDPWKTLIFKAPFPVTTAVVTALKKKVSSGMASTPVSFNASRNRIIGPKYGDEFETQLGTPYTAAGYVSWAGQDGSNYHYLIAMSAAGLVDAIPCAANGADQLKVSDPDTTFKNPVDPWYSHPDPAVNARIALIYKAGGDLSAAKVNMQTFKLNWLKGAGIPYYAVASSNILIDLCGLFVPGALSETQKDAVLACLKARMASTQSGKKAKKVSTPIASTVTAPSQPVPVAPAVPPSPVPVSTLLVTESMLQTLTNLATTKFVEANEHTLTASSKPTKIMVDPNGNRFFFKWRNGEPFQAEIDVAASKFATLVKKGVVPVFAHDYNGNRTSVQPFFSNAEPAPTNPADLSDANIAELLAQHAVDMFLGDHDGHGNNWIMVGTRLVAIDRGQSFKFTIKNLPDSLDPTWHAPGNIGEGYAKKLLIAWSKKEAEIPVSAWSMMLATIRLCVQRFTSDTVSSVMAPAFDALGLKPGVRKRILADIEERRVAYENEWTTTLQKLRKDFDWPTPASGLTMPAIKLTSTPGDLQFTKEEEVTVKEATKAGWQGKSLRIDGPWIENQEVMVRRVVWEESVGVKIPATLIHFRLSKSAGLRAHKSLLSSGVMDVSESGGGPSRLVVDASNGLYEKLFAAIKTINYHLHKKPDGLPNQVTVEAAVSLKPMLKALLDATTTPKGTYAPTGEPNEAVNAMADQYLGYVGSIEYWNANAATLINQHSPTFTEYVYEEPPTAEKPKPKASFKAMLKNQGASYPTVTHEGGEIVVKNFHKPVINSSNVSQFVIEDPTSGGRLFVIPTVESGGLKTGVQGVKGISWGVIPGEPSAATVAHLLKLFATATGISMNKATEQDQHVLYLAKQLSSLQGGGKFTPNSGTALVDTNLVSAMAAYELGDVSAARSILVPAVAAAAGMTTAQVEKHTASESAGYYDARGAGFYRHARIGWDRARLASTLGKNTFVAHALLGHSKTFDFLRDVSVNGALLANEVKPFYGVVKAGASPSSDFEQGGSQGVFCCFRKVVSDYHVKHLYFDLSVALRLDAYIVGSGDSFGNVTTTRYTMPDTWTVGNGKVSSSSPHQLVIRHDVDLQTYLVKAICADASEVAQCIALVKKLGWTFKHGTPETIFVAV